MTQVINEVKTTKKVIALTFDDGPNPVYTREVMDIFRETNGKTTFFMIGKQIEKNQDVVNEAVSEGHEIANHTYSHQRLSELSEEECLKEIEDNERLIESLTGIKPEVFRAPYLDYNRETLQILQEKGYPMIGALNLEAKDWEQPGAGFIYENSRRFVRPGSILLFHDGYGDRSQSIVAVRKLVSVLTLEGYQLITVSELLKSRY